MKKLNARTLTVVGAAIAVGAATATAVAVSSTDHGISAAAITSGPGADLTASMSHLAAGQGPSVGGVPTGGVQATSAAGTVRAWGYTTASGAPAIATVLPDGMRVVGGCEDLPATITKCLSQYTGGSLVVIGRASAVVQRVSITMDDGSNTSVPVVGGVWAAAVPSTSVAAPGAIVGLNASGATVGAADGRRIVSGLVADAAGTAAFAKKEAALGRRVQ